MFRDARQLDIQRTADAFVQAIRHYSAHSEDWFDGSVGSIDRRLAACDRLLHSARATVARLSIADSDRYLHAADFLTSDRRALEALRVDALTGGASREDVVGPPGWRTANLLWDIDDNDNHVAYDNDWNEFGKVFQHPDDNQWYAQRNIDGQPDTPQGPFAAPDAAKTWMNREQTGFNVNDPSTEYWNEDAPLGPRRDSAPPVTRADAEKYFSDQSPLPTMEAEEAVHDWANRYNPPIQHPQTQTIPGPALTNQEMSDPSRREPGRADTQAPRKHMPPETGPSPVIPLKKKEPEPAPAKAAALAGSDRRWVHLEAAKFVQANLDAVEDSHELATRAHHFAQVKTSTFTPQRSDAISRAFVATVTHLGHRMHVPAMPRTAGVDVSFDPQMMFL